MASPTFHPCRLSNLDAASRAVAYPIYGYAHAHASPTKTRFKRIYGKTCDSKKCKCSNNEVGQIQPVKHAGGYGCVMVLRERALN